MSKRVFQRTGGMPLEDLRVKLPTDLVEFVENRYKMCPETGMERSRNAQIATALRELRHIKS